MGFSVQNRNEPRQIATGTLAVVDGSSIRFDGEMLSKKYASSAGLNSDGLHFDYTEFLDTKTAEDATNFRFGGALGMRIDAEEIYVRTKNFYNSGSDGVDEILAMDFGADFKAAISDGRVLVEAGASSSAFDGPYALDLSLAESLRAGFFNLSLGGAPTAVGAFSLTDTTCTLHVSSGETLWADIDLVYSVSPDIVIEATLRTDMLGGVEMSGHVNVTDERGAGAMELKTDGSR